MLQGKTAIVTGSTSGIGAGIARALAAQGCHVVLNGFGDPAAIDALQAEIRRAGAQAWYHAADLSRAAEVAALVAFAVEQAGRVDILVNNAGIQHVAPIEEFPPERWDAVLAVNLSSAFHAIRAAVPHMRRGGWGRVINIASTHGLVASIHKAAYVASKHGLVGLTRVVALETAGSGITCNAICPGWVRTELVERQIAARADQAGSDRDSAARSLLAEKQPSRQFVQVEQVAALATYLCSAAAAQITGATLPIDGGWTAQ